MKHDENGRRPEFLCGPQPTIRCVDRAIYLHIHASASINWLNKLDDVDDDDKIIMQYFI